MSSKSKSMSATKFVSQNWMVILLVLSVLFVMNSGGICPAETRIEDDFKEVYQDVRKRL